MSKDHRQYITFGTADERFGLLAGGSLQQVCVAFETWGELSPAKDNLVLITTGLSASSHVASHAPDDDPGWWEEMVGPGKPVNTNLYFVVCINVLGSCFGSTGPTSIDPATNRPYGKDFPVVNIEDMVEAQVKVLDHFQVDRAFTVVGASLGGMLALQWGAQHPERVASVVGIATPARSYAFSIAWRAVQKWVVMNDPAWKGGDYLPGAGPEKSLTLARAIGILSYRSPGEFDQRFGRDLESGDDLFSPSSQFSVEAYLHHNAKKFGQMFDANSYLLLVRAMDYFDLGRGAPSLEQGVARITAPSLVVGFTTDLLFPIEQQRELHRILRQHQRPSRLQEIESRHGHDSFLIEIGRVGGVLQDFFRIVRP